MNLPEKFVDRMKNMLGKDYDDFITSFTENPIHSGIRINTAKENAAAVVKNVTGTLTPIEWCDDGYYADKSVISGKHPYHCAGLFYFQEPSAMCSVSGLPISRGDKVLDMCAAPGGKATQAGAKLNGSGLLVANEIIKKRADILSENIERMGLKNTIVTNETPQHLSEKYPSFFDKIIVDAPCSGEGMFRKEPQAIDEWSVEHTISCGTRQKHILDCAVKMLKKGGMLVYSTCTFAPEENEKIAAYLVQTHKLEILEMPELYMLEKGRTEWSGTDIDMTFTRRIFPHKQGGEGHFVAFFYKNYGEDLSSMTQKTNRSELCIDLWKRFENDFLNTSLDGDFMLFGENLYLKPTGINIDKIKVSRCGLLLGQCKKNRFEPSHALALALTKEDFKTYENFACDDEKIKTYLSGNVISSDKNGWCAVCVDGYPLGWGKASNGILKNHYPKNLRIV